MAKTVSESAYGLDPVYNGIRTRFFRRYGIDVKAHMESMTWLGPRTEEGTESEVSEGSVARPVNAR